MGPVDEDERWAPFGDMHMYLRHTFPLLFVPSIAISYRLIDFCISQARSAKSDSNRRILACVYLAWIYQKVETSHDGWPH